MSRTIDVRQFIVPKTRFYEAIGWIALVGGLLLLTLFTYGLAPIIWLIVNLTQTKKARALLHGSAVKVGPRQFPEIHKLALEISKGYSMKEGPEIYIIEDNTQNAFALKHGKKKYVILIDDVVHGANSTGDTKVLAFILAHEIAHHALGHSGIFRRMISASFPPLARLDELSCDAAASAHIQDGAACRDALALLLIGPQLFKLVDRAALDAQAREVIADKHTKTAEKMMSHPLLLSRYGRLLASMPRIPISRPVAAVTAGAGVEARLPIAAHEHEKNAQA